MIAALLIIWLVGFILKLRRRGAVSGRDSIVGGVATAMADFSGEGKVWLEGEAWMARSTVPISKDQHVRVTDIDGLIVVVEPVSVRGAGDVQPQT